MATTAQELSVTVDWSEVKQAFMQHMESGDWLSQPTLAKMYAKWKKAPYMMDDFAGDKPANMLGYLRNGFFQPEFVIRADRIPVGLRKRARWNDEEGEVDPGRLAGGHDSFMLGSEDRPSKPGLRIVAEFSFAALVDYKVIRDYCAWLASFIGSLESEGYDLTVDLVVRLRDLYSDLKGRNNVMIRVKRKQELSDFTEWSALFSPGGFRMLGFTALAISGDKLGKQCTSVLGSTISSNWGINYDRNSGTVTINVNQQQYGEDFPEATMTKAAQDANLLGG